MCDTKRRRSAERSSVDTEGFVKETTVHFLSGWPECFEPWTVAMVIRVQISIRML